MKKDISYILIIAAITLLWFIVAFSGFRTVEKSDWDMVFGYHQSQREIILKYHQLPLWNPFFSGGEPWLAHPVSDFLSPFFVFVLLFGTVSGTIIAYLFQALIGLLGIYFLSRYYKLNHNLSLLNAILALSIFNRIAYIGIFIMLSFAFIPWAYLFFNKSKTNNKYFIYTTAVTTIILYSGYTYVFVMLSIILAIDAIFYIFENKKPKFILTLLGILTLSLFLASPKILPMFELLNQYPRLKVSVWSNFLINPGNLLPAVAELKELLLPQESFYFLNGLSNYDFIRHIMLFLLVFSLVVIPLFLWKKYKVLIITGFIFIAISLADKSPLNLWGLLHFFLPSMGGPGKFAAVFLMMFALSIGLTINELKSNTFVNRVLRFILMVLFTILTICIFSFAYEIFKTRPAITYHLDNHPREFTQRNCSPGKIFEIIHNNGGAVSTKAILFMDTIGGQIQKKVLTQEEVGYKGEYYLKNCINQLGQVFFSPNKLIFKLRLIDRDTLVINQNYFPGWHSSRGKVKSCDGLLSVTLNKTDNEATFYYMPASFVLGITLCLLTLLGLMVKLIFIHKPWLKIPV